MQKISPAGVVDRHRIYGDPDVITHGQPTLMVGSRIGLRQVISGSRID